MGLGSFGGMFLGGGKVKGWGWIGHDVYVCI